MSIDNDSVYVPTPERQSRTKLSRVETRKLPFVDLAELDTFMCTVNSVRGCKTPNCEGKLIPVNVKRAALCITYTCDGCQLQGAQSQGPIISQCGISLTKTNFYFVSCMYVAFSKPSGCYTMQFSFYFIF